jgi:CubicO group peptidase (beta-lactamase class C family)
VSVNRGHTANQAAVVAAGAAAAAGIGAGSLWLWRHQADLAFRRPFNEWTFSHAQWLLPTEDVPRSGSISRLPTQLGPLDVDYEFEGRAYSLSELHARTNTTSFLVLHGGTLVHEVYPGRFAGPPVRLLLFSLSKSVTSILIGVALAEGAIGDLRDPVTLYRPELADCAYDGLAIEHLLDMCSGVGDLEDWTNPDALINRFAQAVLGDGSVFDVVWSAPRTAEPGTVFNYSTLDAQVLSWVLEAATGHSIAHYTAEKLWTKLGTEQGAYYALTRSSPRTALGSGSFNACARDVARIGCLMASAGEHDGQQIVPADWVARSRGRGLPHLEVGALGDSGYPHYGYANQWWTLGGDHHAYTGLGVHGQYLYVDPVADVVIVKTSTWDAADDEERDAETIAALRAIVAHLEATPAT